MAVGDFGYGLGKTFAGIGKTASGVVDRGYIGVQKTICETIKEWEDDSWTVRYFLSDFVPAVRNIGDIVCADGEMFNVTVDMSTGEVNYNYNGYTIK